MKAKEFNFKNGDILLDKYYIIGLLGKGWEAEVYQVREKHTGIERAAKFFYPIRNKKNSQISWYAKKLHKLRTASSVVQYQTQEMFDFKGETISFLVSEYISGRILTDLILCKPGKRLSELEAFLLLHSLAKGVAEIHSLKEYHGDLHAENIIVCKQGISFELKFLDMFPRGKATRENFNMDIYDIIKIFYDSIGGQKKYKSSSKEFKYICSGLKHSIISSKFKSAYHLREHIERLDFLSLL